MRVVDREAGTNREGWVRRAANQLARGKGALSHWIWSGFRLVGRQQLFSATSVVLIIHNRMCYSSIAILAEFGSRQDLTFC
jgi:hypothetical protein